MIGLEQEMVYSVKTKACLSPRAGCSARAEYAVYDVDCWRQNKIGRAPLIETDRRLLKPLLSSGLRSKTL
jgi:hypothetical protein